MPGKVYRTAIYCRLSREDGDKVESNSIASQRAICEDYIARHDDLEIVCEPFVDDGYSGVSFNRPNFKKLEDAIRKGAIDCIVVKDLSRFSRNYIDGGRYLEKIFPQLGIRFIAVNDAYDSLTGDPQSDSFVIPFKNLINDSYCKDISMKIRSSLEVKQKNGEFVGAFAPYGYKKSPDNKNQLIVDEAVSEYVQMIFAMYKDGFSIGRIAARLNQIKKMRTRDPELSANWGTICTPVQMPAADGKMRKIQAANTEGLLRIIQSIPSPRQKLLSVGWPKLAVNASKKRLTQNRQSTVL